LGATGKARSRIGAGLAGMWPRHDGPLKDVIFPSWDNRCDSREPRVDHANVAALRTTELCSCRNQR